MSSQDDSESDFDSEGEYSSGDSAALGIEHEEPISKGTPRTIRTMLVETPNGQRVMATPQLKRQRSQTQKSLK